MGDLDDGIAQRVRAALAKDAWERDAPARQAALEEEQRVKGRQLVAEFLRAAAEAGVKPDYAMPTQVSVHYELKPRKNRSYWRWDEVGRTGSAEVLPVWNIAGVYLLTQDGQRCERADGNPDMNDDVRDVPWKVHLGFVKRTFVDKLGLTFHQPLVDDVVGWFEDGGDYPGRVELKHALVDYLTDKALGRKPRTYLTGR